MTRAPHSRTGRRSGAARSIVGRVVGGAVITTACWVVGLSLGNALAIALVVIALFGLRGLAGGEVDSWLPAPESAHNEGTRREVARLSWGLQGQDDRVDRWSAQRLHALAARRVASHGLDLDAPDDAAACRRLLGAPTYEALSLDPNHLPRYAQFVAALGVLEGLSLEEHGR